MSSGDYLAYKRELDLKILLNKQHNGIDSFHFENTSLYGNNERRDSKIDLEAKQLDKNYTKNLQQKEQEFNQNLLELRKHNRVIEEQFYTEKDKTTFLSYKNQIYQDRISQVTSKLSECISSTYQIQKDRKEDIAAIKLCENRLGHLGQLLTESLVEALKHYNEFTNASMSNQAQQDKVITHFERTVERLSLLLSESMTQASLLTNERNELSSQRDVAISNLQSVSDELTKKDAELASEKEASRCAQFTIQQLQENALKISLQNQSEVVRLKNAAEHAQIALWDYGYNYWTANEIATPLRKELSLKQTEFDKKLYMSTLKLKESVAECEVIRGSHKKIELDLEKCLEENKIINKKNHDIEQDILLCKLESKERESQIKDLLSKCSSEKELIQRELDYIKLNRTEVLTPLRTSKVQSFVKIKHKEESATPTISPTNYVNVSDNSKVISDVKNNSLRINVQNRLSVSGSDDNLPQHITSPDTTAASPTESHHKRELEMREHGLLQRIGELEDMNQKLMVRYAITSRNDKQVDDVKLFLTKRRVEKISKLFQYWKVMFMKRMMWVALSEIKTQRGDHSTQSQQRTNHQCHTITTEMSPTLMPIATMAPPTIKINK
ncbi:microtubule cross-linking factor 1 [Acrasis kona]|uniref:Microtubule cross-linking factor 1 n=1 Tax=Acrasis kona TaxID=1008807 RepID=A0AAW2Z1T1_9EUKA